MIVANWKMNGSQSACCKYFECLATELKSPVVVCPPFPLLSTCCQLVRDSRLVEVGAQNCHWKETGAFTGEVSAKLLAELGVSWVILGHSERRTVFNESSQMIAQKVRAALQCGLRVILCVGESHDERAQSQTLQVLKRQVTEALAGVVEVGDGGLVPTVEFSSMHLAQRLVIAYEPIWAIGTGLVAEPAQVDAIHREIKQLFAFPVSILYGGSCNASNAKGFANHPAIDGLLVGGASLDPTSFSAIVDAMAME